MLLSNVINIERHCIIITDDSLRSNESFSYLRKFITLSKLISVLLVDSKIPQHLLKDLKLIVIPTSYKQRVSMLQYKVRNPDLKQCLDRQAGKQQRFIVRALSQAMFLFQINEHFSSQHDGQDMTMLSTASGDKDTDNYEQLKQVVKQLPSSSREHSFCYQTVSQTSDSSIHQCGRNTVHYIQYTQPCNWNLLVPMIVRLTLDGTALQRLVMVLMTLPLDAV